MTNQRQGPQQPQRPQQNYSDADRAAFMAWARYIQENHRWQGPYPQPLPQGAHWTAVAGLVCSLVGLLLFPVVLGPLGAIFGAVGYSEADKRFRRAGHQLAVGAMVVGFFDILIFLVLFFTLGGF